MQVINELIIYWYESSLHCNASTISTGDISLRLNEIASKSLNISLDQVTGNSYLLHCKYIQLFQQKNTLIRHKNIEKEVSSLDNRIVRLDL